MPLETAGIKEQDYKAGSVTIGDSAIPLAEVTLAEVKNFNADFETLVSTFLDENPSLSARDDVSWALKKILYRYIANSFLLMRAAKAKNNLPYDGMRGTGTGMTMGLITPQCFKRHAQVQWSFITTVAVAGDIDDLFANSASAGNPETIDKDSALGIYALFLPPTIDSSVMYTRWEKNGKSFPSWHVDFDISPVFELPAPMMLIGRDQALGQICSGSAGSEYVKPFGVVFYPGNRLRDLATYKNFSPIIAAEAW